MGQVLEQLKFLPLESKLLSAAYLVLLIVTKRNFSLVLRYLETSHEHQVLIGHDCYRQVTLCIDGDPTSS